jgi:group II intron reverse transcriptase/maturase
MEPLEGNMAGASEPDPVFTKQQRIAELAKQSPHMGFTSLAHHIDLRWLYEAYLRTRKDGAVGVDGQTAADYAADLGDNLRSLLERAKSGTYRAPPVRRAHIPKGDSTTETRPIGIPTFEDKVLQRAVVMVLEAIYEQDFRPCSHGFRPGRSVHQALDQLWRQTMGMGGGWVVEVDIRRFFDTLDHAHLRDLLRLRVRDGVLLRLIGKWLKAGVLEDGEYSFPTTGSPQGGVISPLLANVYLHYVLDLWFEEEVVPRLKGRAFLIRYADDFVMGFACEQDARRVLDVLPKRFGKYGLTIHPTKTRLVAFRPPDRSDRAGPDPASQPGSFDLLGFTHYWGRSQKGNWVVKRRTAPSRFRRALRKIGQWFRINRHRPIPEQHQTLWQKLRGHFAYYGITGNGEALRRFRDAVVRLWRRWLMRRKRRGYIPWTQFLRLLVGYPLPPPVPVHSVCRGVGEAMA